MCAHGSVDYTALRAGSLYLAINRKISHAVNQILSYGQCFHEYTSYA
jgi:hypothetical protein